MTSPIVVFLTDPALGLPVTLVAGTALVWLLWNRQDRPMSVVRPIVRPVPDRDPVSRSMQALEAGSYSDVIDRALVRLDEVAQKRFDRPLQRLPRTAWGARRLPHASPTELRAVRALARRLDGLLDVTKRREAGIWIRFDFWRGHAELMRRYRLRLLPLLEDVARWRDVTNA